MDATELDEALRAALDGIRNEGKDDFVAGEFWQRVPSLEHVAARDVRAALDRLWKSGYPIHCNTLGPVKDQLWEFGHTPAPKSIKRNPTGGRRTPVTVKWVVRCTKARDRRQDNEMGVLSFEDEAEAAEHYERMVDDFATAFPRDVRQVEVYFETQSPGERPGHRVHRIVRCHVITPDGYGRGTPNEPPVG